jgi:Mor family transcriptional regulator
MSNYRSITLEDLEKILNQEQIEKFIQHFAGQQFYIPNRRQRAKKYDQIRKDYRGGDGLSSLVEKYGYSKRHIRRIIKQG